MHKPRQYISPVVPGISSPWKMDFKSLWSEYLEMWELPLPSPSIPLALHIVAIETVFWSS